MNKTEKSKEAVIKAEQRRLAALFASLPDNKRQLIEPLIEELAFMKATLGELKEIINASGCSEEYKNGANQYGRKASADLQAYNSLVKNYNTISERLEKMLPAETQRSRLSALRDE